MLLIHPRPLLPPDTVWGPLSIFPLSPHRCRIPTHIKFWHPSYLQICHSLSVRIYKIHSSEYTTAPEHVVQLPTWQSLFTGLLDVDRIPKWRSSLLSIAVCSPSSPLSHPQPPVDGNRQHKRVNLILVLLFLDRHISHSQNSSGLISISQIIPRNTGTIGPQDMTII